ncbi:MAG TPA: glycoside hydrolase family 2 TIM barrel-domain containing protein, partial [Verrucomicrobiota bacterium]|nr:glycoside hydrolase family 2 TIM barrel-domain containing protein [Verrucomicrobiota bacterium]
MTKAAGLRVPAHLVTDLDPDPGPASARVELDGKFFRLGGRRFAVRGVSYGGFAPNAAGEPFPEPAQAQADVELMRTLGANVVRTYDPPPGWLLDLALAAGLRVFTDLAWPAHRCFLDTAADRRAARQAVTDGARRVAGHPALFAVSLANEIPPDVVRWSGPRRVRRFLDDLVPLVRDLDPAALVTFASFPPTEYLQPAATDFVTFNVYLHDPRVLAAYLARLQMIADTRPLLLGECGADARRAGEARQAEIVETAKRTGDRAGLAGGGGFPVTDDLD